MSFAWRRSRTSRSSAVVGTCSALLGPARRPRIAIPLPHPAVQPLLRAPDLRRDRDDRLPLPGMLPGVLPHPAHRSLTHLSRIRTDDFCFSWASISSSSQASEPPENPGRFKPIHPIALGGIGG